MALSDEERERIIDLSLPLRINNFLQRRFQTLPATYKNAAPDTIPVWAIPLASQVPPPRSQPRRFLHGIPRWSASLTGSSQCAFLRC